MSDTVLAIIELGHDPDAVARRAAWIARRYDATLFLLLSDPSLSILRDSFIVSNQAQEVAGSIETAQEAILTGLVDLVTDGSPLEVETDVSHDRPAHEGIMARALEIEPRFVVKGTRYHSAAERATFAYTDWQLIRNLDRPLWFVKPHGWREKPVIVAAVDPTHQHDREAALDRVIVEVGRDLAGRSGGRLKLLHTYQRVAEVGAWAKLEFKPVRVPVADLDRKIREEHRNKLDSLAAAYEIPDKDVHQLPGRTSEVLPAFAREQKADLVIMGALARASLARRALGSTAEQVLDHLHCDILVVRADG